MPISTLLYHDVIADGEQADSSGRPGPQAARYKLTADAFSEQLDRLAAIEAPVCTVEDCFRTDAPRRPLCLTFDDGGVSSVRIAEMLERFGWRGHFFITTDEIGAPAFLDGDRIRDLRRDGHLIGTHTCSHPNPMRECGWPRLLDEWARSSEILSDILHEPVVAGSIPGGAYSPQVAEAASRAGIRYLFTSEPTNRCWRVEDCLAFGRYAVHHNTPAKQVAGLASGAIRPVLAKALAWNVKKAVKRLGGALYYRLADRVHGERALLTR